MNGQVYAWGDPTNNALRTPSATYVFVPTVVPAGGQFKAIAAGGSHALALGGNGQVYAWGSNANGELGFGSTSAYSGPGHVTTASGVYLSNVIGIAAGKDHSAALKDDGTVWTWGSNTDGQLGDPMRATPATRANQSVPSLGDVQSITAGYKTVIAVKALRKVFTWGTNQFGELGTSETPATKAYNTVPNATARPTGFPATIKAVSASCGHKLVLGGRRRVGLGRQPERTADHCSRGNVDSDAHEDRHHERRRRRRGLPVQRGAQVRRQCVGLGIRKLREGSTAIMRSSTTVP